MSLSLSAISVRFSVYLFVLQYAAIFQGSFTLSRLLFRIGTHNVFASIFCLLFTLSPHCLSLFNIIFVYFIFAYFCKPNNHTLCTLFDAQNGCKSVFFRHTQSLSLSLSLCHSVSLVCRSFTHNNTLAILIKSSSSLFRAPIIYLLRSDYSSFVFFFHTIYAVSFRFV